MLQERPLRSRRRPMCLKNIERGEDRCFRAAFLAIRKALACSRRRIRVLLTRRLTVSTSYLLFIGGYALT